MQMMRNVRTLTRVFAVALTMLTSLPSIAQGASEVWLDKAYEKLQNKGVEIAFRISEEGMHLNGKLLIDGERYAYDSEDMKIWFDGTTQWTMQMGSGYNELYVATPTPEEQQAINPYLLLNNYRERYNVTDGGEKNVNGRLTHVVKLEAREETHEPGNVNVYVLSDGSLAAISIIASDGRTFKIEVRSMRNGLTFPKGSFTYPEGKYPADEIIDMR